MPLQNPKKVLICVTEDWFLCSHFLPVVEAIRNTGAEVAVAARFQAHREAIARLGVRTIDLNYERENMGVLMQAVVLWRLVTLLWRERPDAIHLIAMKPMFLGGLAYRVSPVKFALLHFTGVGLLGVTTDTRVSRLWRLILPVIARLCRRRRVWLFAENPDDLDTVARANGHPVVRFSVLGGAGVDPDQFAPQTATFDPPRLAFVGRMIWSKGVDVLVRAHQKLLGRGIAAELHLYGAPDADNPEAISLETLEGWSGAPDVVWHGATNSVAEVWAANDIAVVPSRGGEGLPRVLLEAAASGRPLVVSDVPGCSYFVRDGVEGYLVAPDHDEAMAMALEKIIRHKEDRIAMGDHARKRVVSGFTIAHVKAEVERVYRGVLSGGFDGLPPHPGV